jgi:hypothetical protein
LIQAVVICDSHTGADCHRCLIDINVGYVAGLSVSILLKNVIAVRKVADSISTEGDL